MVKAKLIIDRKEINVLWFTFGFNQGADYSGRPSQRPIFVGLKLIIEIRKDLNLAEWSFSPNQTKQIELHIYPVILGGRTRKLYFYDCHLVNWKNAFSSTGSNPMSETLEITCAGVEDSTSEAVYSSYWRETFPHQEVEPTTLDSNNEKEFTRYYLTDQDGNEIDDYETDDIITLNIETKNRSGDYVTVNLNDVEHDFEHNGSIIENDTLRNILISNDLEQVELKVIDQQEI
ncbi:type VI secretion system tube protein TssD [Tenacibaculum sp.]|nr:type VI secretion system tube protein TssD [Tenacibaculum sp.]